MGCSAGFGQQRRHSGYARRIAPPRGWPEVCPRLGQAVSSHETACPTLCQRGRSWTDERMLIRDLTSCRDAGLRPPDRSASVAQRCQGRALVKLVSRELTRLPRTDLRGWKGPQMEPLVQVVAYRAARPWRRTVRADQARPPLSASFCVCLERRSRSDLLLESVPSGSGRCSTGR